MDLSNKSLWEKFKSVFPYLSILIIILGIIWQATYYSQFNIKIQDYIGVSELFLVIADRAFAILITIGFLIFLGYLFLQNHKETEKKIDDKGFQLWPIFSDEISLSSILVLIILSILIFAKGLYLNFIPLLILFTFSGIYPIIFFLINYIYKKEKKRPLNKNLFNLAYFSILFFAVINNFAYFDAQKAEKGIYTGTKIYTKDSTYVSDSTHFYIGKTTNYYFIYNKDKKSTLVLPEREVSKFELHWNLITK